MELKKSMHGIGTDREIVCYKRHDCPENPCISRFFQISAADLSENRRCFFIPVQYLQIRVSERRDL